MLTLALLAPSTTQASPNPCRTLKPDVVEHAIDYAMERSSRGELAEVYDLRVRVDIRGCEPQSRRRASWHFRLVVRDASTELLREDGAVMVTRQRATWNVRDLTATAPHPQVP